MNRKTSFSYRLPSVLGIAHGASDGAAGLLLGGLATSSSAAQITLPALIALGVAAGIGKISGGFAAERLGYRRWTLVSLLIAAPLLAFAGKKLALLLPGMALLQSSIPCSIAAMARLLPARPAFATGLVLGLAVALGGLPSLLAIPPALAPAVALAIILVAAVGFWFTTEPRRSVISLEPGS